MSTSELKRLTESVCRMILLGEYYKPVLVTTSAELQRLKSINGKADVAYYYSLEEARDEETIQWLVSEMQIQGSSISGIVYTLLNNPHVPPQVLLEIGESVLLSHPNFPLLRVAIDDEELKYVVRNPNCSPDLLDRAFAYGMVEAVALHPNTPERLRIKAIKAIKEKSPYMIHPVIEAYDLGIRLCPLRLEEKAFRWTVRARNLRITDRMYEVLESPTKQPYVTRMMLYLAGLLDKVSGRFVVTEKGREILEKRKRKYSPSHLNPHALADLLTDRTWRALVRIEYVVKAYRLTNLSNRRTYNEQRASS